jgi:hypothetical protein
MTVFYSRRMALHCLQNRRPKLNYKFRQRYPDLAIQFRDPIASAESAKTQNIIRRWFNCGQRRIFQSGKSEDIYHFDEAGSALGSMLNHDRQRYQA